MIVYFPKPLPDEILYSMIARYGAHTLTTSYQPLMRVLYGKKSLETNIDLPGHMSLFSKNTQRVLSLTDDELINKHTLWPYYAHFIKKERYKETIESMKMNDARHMDLKCGLRSSNINRVKTPQYCPTCCLEDLEEFGEMYWHRKHQIPSILVCPKHDCYLQTAKLDGLLFTKKFQFINASLETCTQTVARKNANPVVRSLSFRMSELLDIPNGSQQSSFMENLQNIRELYKEDGRIQFTEMANEFYDFLGKETAGLYQNSQKWTERKLLTFDVAKSEITINPLRNMLIEKFMTEKSKTARKIEPTFNIESIPCVNIIAHPQRNVQVPLTEVRLSKRKRCQCGYFVCQCGTTQGVYEYDKGNYSEPFIENYGENWKNELKRAFKSGQPRETIANKFKLTVYQITHYRHKFSHEISKDQKEQSLNRAFKLKVEKYRSKWLEALENHPNLSITAIGKTIPYAYFWLVRNDNDWLLKTNSTHSPELKRQPRFEYPNLDQLFYQKILDAYERLVSSGFKNRISRSLLKRSANINIKKMIPSKFPLTTELLEKASETSDGKRIRLSKYLR